MSQSRASRRVRLELERLEPREVPAVLPGTVETFDATAPPALPAGWSQWSSQGAGIFATSDAQAFSAPNSLASTAPSNVTGRAWENTPTAVNTGVEADVLASSLIPVQLFARGANLGSASPSYYAVSVSRGVDVALLRVVDGTATTLASVASKLYLSSAWLQVGLTLDGDQLAVQVFRPDTSQYLNANGAWTSTPANALQATDAALSGAGLVGVNRPASYAGSAALDNFTLLAPGSAPPPASLPTIPQHLPSIRIAELAYSGTPLGPFEQQLLQTSVDLVVPAPQYLSTINQAAPTTPQLIYSNVSNLYGSLLTDWLNWADANHVPREDAFYHVSAPTPFTGTSASSQPVDWFWNVALGPTSGTTGFINLTGAAHAGGSNAFGGAGQALDIGYTEQFNEINFALTRGKQSGFSFVIEYPTAVDASGNPTAWKALPLVSDGTDGLSKSGEVTFDPPAGWVTAVVPGSTARLYYVRVRTVTGTAATAPVAMTILGDDYVDADGTDSGVIPVFDYAADANHNGYLTAAEYAVAESIGDDARFAYQARLFYPDDGQMRFILNPTSTAVRSWAIDENVALLQANPLADGIFMDNSSGKAPTTGFAVVEATASYSTDFSIMLGEINAAIAPKWVMANIADSGAGTNQVVSAVPAALDESAIRALDSTWAQFSELASSVATWQSLTNPSGYLVLDSTSTGGAETDPRTQMATLAYYDLIGNPKTTFLMLWGGEAPSSSWTNHWFDALSYNIGQPTSPYTLFATGQDPSNPALIYNIYARQYTDALVLYKPLSYTLGLGTGTTAANTATKEQLGGAYRELNADGTLGPVITSISLANGEGAVLIRQ
jgi:hypothetical protein